MASGFKKFLLRGNVVDMAVGVVVGAAFATVVGGFTKDLLTPFIAAIFQRPDFSNFYFTINKSKFLYGDFINALIAFLIVVATVYYFVVLPMNTLVERSSKPPAPAAPTTKKCPECQSDVPIAAKRCAFCTSALP